MSPAQATVMNASTPSEHPWRTLWSSQQRRWTWIVLALALVLRLAWGLAIPVHPVSDSIPYDTYARNLRAGFGYVLAPGDPPSGFWPPGTGYFYAGVYALTGMENTPTGPGYTLLASYVPVALVQALLGTLIALLTMVLGVHYFGRGLLGHATFLGSSAGVRAAQLGGLLVALWPLGVQFTTVLQSEILFTVALLAGLACFELLRSRPLLRALSCGMFFAIAAYTRPTALLVPPILFGVEFLFVSRFAGQTRPRTFLTALGTGLLMAALIAPWTYRNYRVYDTFVPISTNAGHNMWMGNRPGTTGEYADFVRDPALNEAQNDKKFKQEAVDYIKKYPGEFLVRTGYKLLKMHKQQTIGVVWNTEGLARRGLGKFQTPLKAASAGAWLLILGSGLVGMVVLWVLSRRTGTPSRAANALFALLHPLIIVPVYFATLHAVYVIQDRYTFPYTPLLALLGALAVTCLACRKSLKLAPRTH
jgi:hypothetical protein